MLATLSVALFAATALIVAISLADSWLRFANAWRIARRQLAGIEADVTFGMRSHGKEIALRRSEPARAARVVSRLGARRRPLACAA